MKKAIKYCLKHDILEEFLKMHSTEVFNMLLTEWNMDDALAVRYEEGLEDGHEEGLEKGLRKGLERGLEKGREEGLEKGREDVVKNALANGLSLEMIQKITGLDIKTIERLGVK